MGRRYTVPFENITVSVPQDLASIIPDFGSFPASTAKLLRVWLFCTNTTLPTAQQLSLRVRRLQSMVVGSGGSVPGEFPDDPGDAAALYIGRVNDTTKATGTPDWKYEFGCYLYTGADLVFSDPPACNGNDGFVFELLSTVSTPVILSGGLLFEEIGSGL